MVSFPPQPPAFLSGPGAVLLTNAEGFSSYAVMEPGPGSIGGKTVSGQLLARGGKLLFLPDADKTQKKPARSVGISYLWDVAQGSGYVLSEALQGYAPVSSRARCTNLVAEIHDAAPQRIDGHPCVAQTMTMSASDGSMVRFEAWQATDLNGLPVRVASAANSASFTLNLSKVRLAPQPGGLFVPPSGFTRYNSVEAMMTELALRQQNLSRPTPGVWTQPELMNNPTERRSR